MTGSELLAAHGKDEEFDIGRRGGLDGPHLGEDISSGKWKTQHYETNRDSKGPPSVNWFLLSEFMAKANER